MEEGFQTVNLHGCASGVIATPVIGQNGNWFIGNKDTGVCAKGVEGDKGENGQQGSKGDQGDVGPAGAQGIQGIQGIQGEQGIKGDRGDIGEQGVQGLQGTQGKQGPKGDKGDTGPVGPQGEQGPKGTDADNAELERLSDEVVKVNQSLTTIELKLQNKFATIRGVSPSAINVLAIHPYPTGFNVSNTIILSINVDGTDTGASTAFAAVRENGIGIQVAYAAYLNKPFKIALFRDDI